LASKAAKKMVVNLLGLNLVPVTDQETGNLRRPEDHEIIPLAMLTASPEMLKTIIEQNQALVEQDEALESDEDQKVTELTPDELDAMFSDDLVFLNNPEELEKKLVMESPETKRLVEQLVTIRDDGPPKAEELSENSDEIKDSVKTSVKIESDDVSADPVNQGRSKIEISDSE